MSQTTLHNKDYPNMRLISERVSTLTALPSWLSVTSPLSPRCENAATFISVSSKWLKRCMEIVFSPASGAESPQKTKMGKMRWQRAELVSRIPGDSCAAPSSNRLHLKHWALGLNTLTVLQHKKINGSRLLLSLSYAQLSLSSHTLVSPIVLLDEDPTWW